MQKAMLAVGMSQLVGFLPTGLRTGYCCGTRRMLQLRQFRCLSSV
jgi:hypothetical protein